MQTPWKLLGFHRTEDRFWADFADIKHDYTQEFHRSYSSFISQCPRTGKFCGVWKWSKLIISFNIHFVFSGASWRTLSVSSSCVLWSCLRIGSLCWTFWLWLSTPPASEWKRINSLALEGCGSHVESIIVRFIILIVAWGLVKLLRANAKEPR